MKKSKKMIRNLIIFILLILITFYILLKDQNTDEMFDALLKVNKGYIAIAIVFMFFYLVLEAVNLRRTLKALKEKITFKQALKYAYIGFFFSAITPAASGGQPMQVYYIYKDNISVGNSTLSLLINLSSFQIITIPFAIICVFFYNESLTVGLKILFVIGIALNSTALMLLLIGIFSKRLSQWLIKVSIKILKFFKVKKIEEKQEKLEKEVSNYQASAVYIRENKKMILKTIFTTFIQVLIFYSIPYWIYLSFGFSNFNIIQIIALQSILYATVSGIPLPGAVGVSEGGFMGIFASVFTVETISGAMLLNRGVSFYLYVLISGIVIIFTMIKSKKNNNMYVEQENIQNNIKIDNEIDKMTNIDN